jgi:predicted MFS family arabinose efflux permease
VSWGPAIMRLTDARTRERAFTWNVAILIGSSAVWTALAGFIPDWADAVHFVPGLSGTQVVLLGGAVISAIALFCYGALPETHHAPAPAKLIAPPREVRTLVPLIAFWMLASAIVSPFLNVFFADRFVMPVRWIGVLFASAHVGTAVALLVAAEAARHWGARRMVVWWMLALAPSLIGLAVADALAIAVGLYFVQGLVGPATNPLIDQLVLERVDRSRHGVVAAWRNAAAEASGAIGAGLGGRLLDASSFNALFLVAGAVAMGSALLLINALRSNPVPARLGTFDQA